jgi:aminoglycoside 3-N-acetyltransferase
LIIVTLEEFSEYLDRGFNTLGVYGYPLVYLFTDLRGWAARLGTGVRRDDLFMAIAAPLLEHRCTIVTPSFSYTDNNDFHVETTPSALGAFPRWFLRQPEAERSEHPLFSLAAMGSDKASTQDLVRNCGKSAFGARSVFERMSARDCLCVHLGHNVNMGNTMIHYVEQMCGAPYRFNKIFPTKVYRGEEFVGGNYSAFVRRLDVPGHDFITDASKNAENMRGSGIIGEVGSNDDLSNITVFDYRRALEAMMDDYERDQNIFLSRPFPGE